MEPRQNQKGKKHKKHKNSHAREVTLQALYQIDVVNQSLETVLKLSWLNEEPASAEKSYIYTLIEGIAEYQDEIDDVVDSFSDKDSTQISTIVRSILRIGVFEIMKGELEPGIVIDDLLDLTRKYDGEESVAFVNGILDSFKIEKNKQEQA